MMRVSIAFFILLMMGQIATSQIHEIGVIAGGGNYVGDVGATNYIVPNTIASGVIYKWNTHSRYAYRASAMYIPVRGMDSKSDIPSRQERNFEFKNNVWEVSAGVEFNFLDYNMHDFGIAVTPYVYSGVSYFGYDALYIENDEALKYDTDNAFAIPMALGVKSNVFGYIVIALEVNVRYTFTDNLDGSNPPDSPYSDFSFGNVNSNDWYVFSGISITYTFGRNPCYCAKK